MPLNVLSGSTSELAIFTEPSNKFQSQEKYWKLVFLCLSCTNRHNHSIPHRLLEIEFISTSFREQIRHKRDLIRVGLYQWSFLVKLCPSGNLAREFCVQWPCFSYISHTLKVITSPTGNVFSLAGINCGTILLLLTLSKPHKHIMQRSLSESFSRAYPVPLVSYWQHLPAFNFNAQDIWTLVTDYRLLLWCTS